MTVPLDKALLAAELVHVTWCTDTVHAPACLLPEVQTREALLAEQYQWTQVSGDCQDPVKHGACGGCACECHRHHNRPV